MKKIIILVMALVLAFSFAACGSRQADQSDLTKEPSVSSEEETVVLPEDFVVPTIEQTELANEKGIIITAKELIYDPSEGWGLTVTMENNSDSDVYIQNELLAVNHFRIFNQLGENYFFVGSGQTCTEIYNFGINYLFQEPSFDFLHMTAITDIEMSFYVLKTWQIPGDPRVYNEELFTSDVAELHTSEYENGPQTASISGGVEVYNENGLRIVAKCIRSREEDNDLEVIMFVENLSDRSVFVEAEDFRINNTALSYWIQCKGEAGFMAISNDYFTSEELRSDGIRLPESASAGFQILDEFRGDVLEEISSVEIPVETE